MMKMVPRGDVSMQRSVNEEEGNVAQQDYQDEAPYQGEVKMDLSSAAEPRCQQNERLHKYKVKAPAREDVQVGVSLLTKALQIPFCG